MPDTSSPIVTLSLSPYWLLFSLSSPLPLFLLSSSSPHHATLYPLPASAPHTHTTSLTPCSQPTSSSSTHLPEAVGRHVGAAGGGRRGGARGVSGRRGVRGVEGGVQVGGAAVHAVEARRIPHQPHCH
eukprot:1162774-Rhodomonas_salina.1